MNVMSRWRVLSKENNLEMESNSLPQKSTENIEIKVDNIKEKNRIWPGETFSITFVEGEEKEKIERKALWF